MESEEVDEINEAYADILEELGNYVKNSFCSRYIYLAGYAQTVEDNFEEGMPSCLPLLVIDYMWGKLGGWWNK